MANVDSHGKSGAGVQNHGGFHRDTAIPGSRATYKQDSGTAPPGPRKSCEPRSKLLLKEYVAVSAICMVLLVGVRINRLQLLGVHIRAPDS